MFFVKNNRPDKLNGLKHCTIECKKTKEFRHGTHFGTQFERKTY